jgi:phosphate:Na+ symporter
MTATILGGVGLFLVGMVLMTSGLQAAAGDALRSLLHRFTRGPMSSLLTGTVFTALIQSSSAATLATIGFVGAGLITFSQSVGIILGANLGTTVTSWLVAVVGFKVKIDAFALPLVGVGALVKLFVKGRRGHLGQVVAGFGLIFLGIDFLQGGMADFGDRFDLARLPVAGIGGRLVLVLFGIVVTVVMQSSSAAVATTLAALHTGALSLDQAAAVVIGQNVGTTVKAGVGAIGASLPAKRTALAHVVFNLATGALALLTLPLFVWSVGQASSRLGWTDPAVSLAAFHTAFNVLGVAVFLPILGRFASWIERILPERPSPLLWRLQTPQDMVPEIAVDAARLTLLDVMRGVLSPASEALAGRKPWRDATRDLETAAEALAETRTFIGALHSSRDSPRAFARHLAAHHAADHLVGLVSALGDEPRASFALSDSRIRPFVARIAEQWRLILDAGETLKIGPPVEAVEAAAVAVAEGAKDARHAVLEETALGEISGARSGRLLAALNWTERVSRHGWRAALHLWEVPIQISDDAPETDDASDTDDAPATEDARTEAALAADEAASTRAGSA